MNLSYVELARLNQIISIAFLSGKIAMDEISESLHRKITGELLSFATEQKGG